VEQSALDTESAYVPEEFLRDLREGIWQELRLTEIEIDPFRRNLQRTYLEIVDLRLNGRNPVSTDMRAFLRGELQRIDEEISEAYPRAINDATRYHLNDVRTEIGNILEPKIARFSNSQDRTSFAEQGNSCWPDLIIRP
jgi:hypothetical protein